MKKENKAITLIALIITIIVLLILSGVVINLTMGDNGIIGKVQTAVGKYKNAVEEEKKMDLSIELQNEETNVMKATREEMWNGATMLTATISNMTGGTFTINVNNVEAHNYGTLYYYVNNSLVYKGEDSSFQVTQVNGEYLEDGKTYQVKVLAEPFTLSVTTGIGDNVDSWLACIGNTNTEGYTLENLDDLFNNGTLMHDLLNNENAVNYLLKSTEKIYPAFVNYNNYELMLLICSNSNSFTKVANNEKIMKLACESSSFRNAMYDKASVTQNIIANSSTALATMKKVGSQFTTVTAPENSSATLYSGKAFVFQVWQSWHMGDYRITHGNYIVGNKTYTYKGQDGYTSTGTKQTVNKFASSIVHTNNAGSGASYNYYATIFKI